MPYDPYEHQMDAAAMQAASLDQFSSNPVQDEMGDKSMMEYLNPTAVPADGASGSQTLTSGQLDSLIGQTILVPVQQLAMPSVPVPVVGWPVIPMSTIAGLGNPAPAPAETPILNIQSPSQKSRVYTLTLSQRSNQIPYADPAGAGPSHAVWAQPRARAHIQWGAGGGQADAWIDIGRGAVISVATSFLRVWASVMGSPNDPATEIAAQNISAAIGEGGRLPTLPLRVTETWVVLPTAGGGGSRLDFSSVVPPFAKDVIITRVTLGGTITSSKQLHMYMAVLDGGSGILTTREIPVNVPMIIPEPLPDGAAAVEIYCDGAVADIVDQLFTLSYGLSL